MKFHLKFLITLFVVLLLTLLLVWTWQRPQKRFERPSLFSVSADQVKSFALNNFTLGLLFTKKDDQWMVQRVKNDLVKDLEQKSTEAIVEVDDAALPAQTDDVNALLTTLFSVKNLELVSTTAGEGNVFEINKFSLHVILFDENNTEIDRAFFGKQGPEPGTLFVKRGDSQNIYLIETDPRLLLLKKYEEWLTEPPAKK